MLRKGVLSVFARLVLTIAALISISTAESFDQPKYKRTVDLGRSPAGFGARAKVNCYFYPNFMVKEVDMGEKGAERLAIVPIEHGVIPRCTRARSKNEMVIKPTEWRGYFKGVKGDLVFFNADDGWNGGMPFAIYQSRTGKKIFEDSASGDLEFLPAQGSALLMKYMRVIGTECNAFQDPVACLPQIRKTVGLENSTMPDCKKGYEQSAHDLAKGRCQAQGSDNAKCFDKELQLAQNQTYSTVSVIAYPVAVTLDSQATIKPVSGELKCWPAD